MIQQVKYKDLLNMIFMYVFFYFEGVLENTCFCANVYVYTNTYTVRMYKCKLFCIYVNI